MKKPRIPLPESRKSDFLKLAKRVLDKHLAEGDKSLLNQLDWETLQPAIERAYQMQQDAEAYRIQSKICIEERNNLMNAVKIAVRSSRNVLSGVRMTSMQTLGEWGFDVIDSPLSKTKALPDKARQQPPETT